MTPTMTPTCAHGSSGTDTLHRPQAPWDNSQAALLAELNCERCAGDGHLVGVRGGRRPCGCVLRAIFRQCEERYHLYGVTPWRFPSAPAFRADFWWTAKRLLTKVQWRVFSCYVVDGRRWWDCMRRLGLDRGTFWHYVYRIQERLGHAFATLRPYALFPCDEYQLVNRCG